MEQILSEFETTIVYSKFASDSNCIALFVGGSYSFGLADEESDLDLIAIYTQKPTDSVLTHGHCEWKDENRKVVIHWYLWDLDSLFCAGLETRAKRLFFCGRIASARRLHVNPKFEKLIGAIEDLSEEFLDTAGRVEVRTSIDLINATLERGWVDWRKKLYLFLMITASLLCQELDKNFIKNVQRHRIKELGERENEFVLNWFRDCLEINCDTEKAEKDLLARLKNLSQQCISST